MDKIFLVVNPHSGEKNGRAFVQKLEPILSKKNILTHMYETTGNDNFKAITEKALEKGFKTVLIVGGDGTISEYVNQIADLTIRPSIILLPLGTTNNLARALHTELDDEKLLNKVGKFNFIEKQIDVGKMNDRYFVSTVSVGAIPETAWKTDDDIKEKLGPFAYLIKGLDTLTNQKNFDVTMVLDGIEQAYYDVFLIVIGLSNSVFGIPTFFNEATIDDGRFHLFILKNDSLLNEVGSIAQQIFDETNSPEKDRDNESMVYTTSFKEGRMYSKTPFSFTVDGEKGSEFPVNLVVYPNHLTFLVPEKD